MEKFRELSSIFGDYRNLHFHSGIDITTQKKTGFEVVAPESGWVFRIYTSWWGYGKALYLKLDDGRLTLFGHLSDFAPAIREYVEQKQLEAQSYFLNIFLDEDQIRIEKGELVGFSGETGSGAAHLHFELRDEKNHPLNPLNHGFWAEDTTSPTIKKIAFKPMGINSFVNGTDEVVIVPLVCDSNPKNCTLKEIPILQGKIGLGVSTYDETGKRRFGIYKATLFLDDEMIFSSRYDTLNLDNTWMVDLDRDFQLLKQGKGHFYKLYLDSGNELKLYFAPGPDKGIVNTERLDSLSRRIYRPGIHRIKISVEDVSGNSSSTAFSVIFDKKPEIKITEIIESENSADSVKSYLIKGKMIDNGRLSEIEIGTSLLKELKWTKGELVFKTEEDEFSWFKDVKKPTLIRLILIDQFGLKSDPIYFPLGLGELNPNPERDDIKLNLDHDFKDGFLRFSLRFDQVLMKKPQLLLKVGGFEFQPLFIRQIDENSYQAIYPFAEARPKDVMLKVECQSLFGDSAAFAKKISLSIASMSHGGETVSEDGMAKIKIDSGTVFKPIQLKIEKKSLGRRFRKEAEIYSYEPKDVPFAKRARISLSYEGRDCDPERLALYEYKNKSWRFVGDELNPEEKTVSGEVRSLSSYALLEDVKAPGIKIIYPRKWQRIKKRLPQIYAKIWDDLSGFGADKDITVTIDNLWVIPEYDPEKGILKTKPSQALTYGWHTLKIVAKDKAGNIQAVKRKFKVIK